MGGSIQRIDRFSEDGLPVVELRYFQEGQSDHTWTVIINSYVIRGSEQEKYGINVGTAVSSLKPAETVLILSGEDRLKKITSRIEGLVQEVVARCKKREML